MDAAAARKEERLRCRVEKAMVRSWEFPAAAKKVSPLRLSNSSGVGSEPLRPAKTAAAMEGRGDAALLAAGEGRVDAREGSPRASFNL